jgi:hypothetical protein
MNPDVRRGSDDGPAATPMERAVREDGASTRDMLDCAFCHVS